MRRAAGAVELVVRRAVAHGIVDCDLVARPDRNHGDDGDLSVEAGVRLARVIDVVRRLVRVQRGKIKALLDLRGVAADIVGEVVELLGGDQAPTPHSNNLAGLNKLPSEYGLATGHVTISDFALFGEVSRRTLAHETSAMARRAVRFAVYSWAVPSAPGSSSARKETPTRGEAYEKRIWASTKNAPRSNFSRQRSGRYPLPRRRPDPPRRSERGRPAGAKAWGA